MTDDELSLGRDCFGYGRWDAAHWFVGPEQGQGRAEAGSLTARAKAFRNLQIEGLCDCREFHKDIGVADWHVPNGRGDVKLQPTWKSLILTLKILLNKPSETDLESRRDYQRSSWGSSAGETCVIELSGLPAHSFKIDRDRVQFRRARMQFIHDKMRLNNPEFVTIYGISQKNHWLNFWKEQNRLIVSVSKHIFKMGPMNIAFAPSPTAPGLGNQLWLGVGEDLLRASKQ